MGLKRWMGTSWMPGCGERIVDERPPDQQPVRVTEISFVSFVKNLCLRKFSFLQRIKIIMCLYK